MYSPMSTFFLWMRNVTIPSGVTFISSTLVIYN